MRREDSTQQSARAVARELAVKAAASIGAPVSEVVRRPKSLAWILGRLRKRFPHAGDDELRAVVRHLPREQFEDVPPPPPPSPVARSSRGREPGTEDVWCQRAKRLAALLEYSLRTHELLDIAKARLGWSKHITVSVLSAAEDLGLVTFSQPLWLRCANG